MLRHMLEMLWGKGVNVFGGSPGVVVV